MKKVSYMKYKEKSIDKSLYPAILAAAKEMIRLSPKVQEEAVVTVYCTKDFEVVDIAWSTVGCAVAVTIEHGVIPDICKSKRLYNKKIHYVLHFHSHVIDIKRGFSPSHGDVMAYNFWKSMMDAYKLTLRTFILNFDGRVLEHDNKYVQGYTKKEDKITARLCNMFAEARGGYDVCLYENYKDILEQQFRDYKFNREEKGKHGQATKINRKTKKL